MKLEIAQCGVENVVALSVRQFEAVQVGERHSRYGNHGGSFFGRKHMRVWWAHWREHAVFHIKPVAIVICAGVGLYAEECTKIIKKADVEIGYAMFDGVEQQDRLI